MECEFDEGLVIGETGGAQVRLWHRVDSDDGMDDGVIDVCVEITHTTETVAVRTLAHGVTLVVIEDGPATFLAGLAADFAGWSGERTWRNLDGDIEIGARHVSGGYVDLRWTLRSRPYGWVRPWHASVTVRVEAGEQMRRLAADVHHFLRG